MTDDQHVGKNEEGSEKDSDSTQDDERESEQASEDIESLFEDSDEAQEDEAPEDKVKRLEEKIARIEKGVKKMASEKGREAKEKKEVKEEKEDGATQVNPVLKSLYFKANPEAENVWDEVVKEAQNLKKDPFALYESSAYFKGEAQARAEAKAKEEENKKKVNKPSSDTDFSKNLADVKEEDIGKLTPAQKVKWVEAQVKKEKASIE